MPYAPMYRCSKRFSNIPFAHRQPRHEGHCSQIHGHNWTFEFTFAASQRDENGFVVDFGDLGYIKDIVAQFDHALVLVRSDPMLTHLKASLCGMARIIVVKDASCEGLAHYLADLVADVVREKTEGRARLARVTVSEGDNNCATYDLDRYLVEGLDNILEETTLLDAYEKELHRQARLPHASR